MKTMTSTRIRKMIIGTGIAVAALASSALPASAASTSVSGGSVSAVGYYRSGKLTSYGTVWASSGCAHADVKLALANVNDYQWTEARACNGSKSWSTSHYGPILSSFSSSSVQGVYVRVCKEISYRPDNCSGWTYIGRI